MKFRTSVVIFGTLAALAVLRLFLAAVTPLFDPSEGRYAVLCANMASSGDFLVPRFIHEGVFQSFDGKPPLLFQMGGFFCRFLGRTELAVRLPSLLAALGLLALLYRSVRMRADRAAAWVAMGVCATSVAFFASAGFCMTDLPLTFCVVGALLLEDLFNRNPSRRTSLGVFALLGLGMLVKGPVALVLFGLPVFIDACVNRRWSVLRHHAWVLGPFVFLLVAAPWYVLMERTTPGFLKYFFVNENLLRFLVHDYGDKYGAGREAFRGVSFLWAIVVTLPWTPLAFLPGGGRWKGRCREFLWIAFFAIIGFWGLTSRVPLAYLIPVAPLFAAAVVPEWEARRLRRFVPVAAFVAVVALGGTLLYTWKTTSKMARDSFRALVAEHPEAHFYFPKHQAYSAEFYLGERLHAQPSPGDLPIVRKHGKWEVRP